MDNQVTHLKPRAMLLEVQQQLVELDVRDADSVNTPNGWVFSRLEPLGDVKTQLSSDLSIKVNVPLLGNLLIHQHHIEVPHSSYCYSYDIGVGFSGFFSKRYMVAVDEIQRRFNRVLETRLFDKRKAAISRLAATIKRVAEVR